jgi:hypothetical protein
MDGVILYNPIRFVRPIAKFLKPFKPVFLRQEKEAFYYPNSVPEKIFFRLLHKTSFMVDPGVKDIELLVKSKKIKAYIITGRYSFLKKDYEAWLKKIDAKKIFEKCYQNEKDLQPNKFKELTIKKLDLDIYIEDNFDIVKKIQNKKSKTKIFWITNFLDKYIPYQYKFRNLKQALQYFK